MSKDKNEAGATSHLTQMLGLIVKKLGLNNIDDLQKWLDEPQPDGFTDEWLLDQMQVSINLAAKSKTDIDYPRFVRGFANRVLMSFGDKDGVYKAMTTPFTNKT
jgi:hypothetical protein